MVSEIRCIQTQAHLHHAWFLGLQLMVSSRQTPKIIEKWLFRLFRRQHTGKFLSSFSKLGLSDLPDAVACAQYHVLSNSIGGVAVEYMPDNDRKAWVRFRYPRWIYHGATLCGLPVEASRGFLKGWYAQNGVSLNNPKLGFVCVSEDMTGEFGLCGYFKEFDATLKPSERLQFAKDEKPPPFNTELQPEIPSDQWGELRLAKANRNYAMDYIRNGLCELAVVVGTATAQELGKLSAKLIGLQYFSETAERVDVEDGDLVAAALYLQRMFIGMGDQVEKIDNESTDEHLQHRGLRIIRALAEAEAELVLGCWTQLWQGAMQAQQIRKTLTVTQDQTTLHWVIGIE